MNASKDDTSVLSCGFEFIPLNPTNISPTVYGGFVFKIAINVITCPFTILLNILVMIAVKTNRELRTKSNVALVCLATTDLVVGICLQPLLIATFSLFVQGGETANVLCTLINANRNIGSICTLASLYHLFLTSGERYLAIKHSFAYETGLVTEARIFVASGLAWVVAASIYPVAKYLLEIRAQFVTAFQIFGILFVIMPMMVYFHVAIYKEVRRNEEQIIANQVSLEAKAKMRKNKRAFYTTVILLFIIILCYIPAYIWTVILVALKDRIPSNVGHIVFNITSSLQVLNSLCNPLIYAARIRHFRVVFIQLLSRKSLAQAEELERKIFGSRRIGVVVNAAQEENRDGREENVQNGNETLNNEQAPVTAGAQPQEQPLQENSVLEHIT